MKKSPPRRRSPSVSLLQSSVSWFRNPTSSGEDEHRRVDRRESRDDIELMSHDNVVKHGNDKEAEGTNVHVRESVGSNTEEKDWDNSVPV